MRQPLRRSWRSCRRKHWNDSALNFSRSNCVTKRPSWLETAPMIATALEWAHAAQSDQSLPMAPISGIWSHVAGNGIRPQTKDQSLDFGLGEGVFLYVLCSSRSAWAMTGRGFLRRKPNSVNSLWHWRTPRSTSYSSARWWLRSFPSERV